MPIKRYGARLTAGFFSMNTKPIITLASDFGLSDHYVGAMKGEILTRCADVHLVDITHQISPQSVREAAYLLEQYWFNFPEGSIHLCVVDPGVGGSRQPVAINYENRIYVGPDNGSVSYLVQKSHRWKARILDKRSFHATTVSRTFHGRDIFAPVAGHLAAGASFDEIGSPLTEIRKLDIAPVIMGTKKIQGEVIHIDHFGNVVTNIQAQHFDWGKLEPHEAALKLGPHHIGPFVTSYSSAKSDPCFLYGSGGYLEIAVKNGSAADAIGAKPGDEVTVFQASLLLSI